MICSYGKDMLTGCAADISGEGAEEGQGLWDKASADQRGAIVFTEGSGVVSLSWSDGDG